MGSRGRDFYSHRKLVYSSLQGCLGLSGRADSALQLLHRSSQIIPRSKPVLCNSASKVEPSKATTALKRSCAQRNAGGSGRERAGQRVSKSGMTSPNTRSNSTGGKLLRRCSIARCDTFRSSTHSKPSRLSVRTASVTEPNCH